MLQQHTYTDKAFTFTLDMFEGTVHVISKGPADICKSKLQSKKQK